MAGQAGLRADLPPAACERLLGRGHCLEGRTSGASRTAARRWPGASPRIPRRRGRTRLSQGDLKATAASFVIFRVCAHRARSSARRLLQGNPDLAVVEERAMGLARGLVPRHLVRQVSLNEDFALLDGLPLHPGASPGSAAFDRRTALTLLWAAMGQRRGRVGQGSAVEYGAERGFEGSRGLG